MPQALDQEKDLKNMMRPPVFYKYQYHQKDISCKIFLSGQQPSQNYLHGRFSRNVQTTREW